MIIILAHIVHERQCIDATVCDYMSELNFQEKKSAYEKWLEGGKNRLELYVPSYVKMPLLSSFFSVNLITPSGTLLHIKIIGVYF